MPLEADLSTRWHPCYSHMPQSHVTLLVSHLADGICLPDIRQELVAQALTLAGTTHQTSDVNKLNSGGHLHSNNTMSSIWLVIMTCACWLLDTTNVSVTMHHMTAGSGDGVVC